MESIVCKNCLPEEYQHMAKQLRGCWTVDREASTAKCNNCGFERPFHSRQCRNRITPSQQKAIDRIEHFFKDWQSWDNAYKYEQLHKFEVILTEYGTVFVSVETNDHTLTMQGGHFSIGRRGAITVHSSYGLIGDRNETKRYYAQMLQGKVSKYQGEYVSIKYITISTCSFCKFFERNKQFPNRYGKCTYPRYPTADHYVQEEVHDSFGCIHWEKSEMSDKYIHNPLEVSVHRFQKRNSRFMKIKIGSKELCTLRWMEPILPGDNSQWWLDDSLSVGTNELDAVENVLEYFGYK